MKLTARQRWLILAGALAVTLVLTFWPNRVEEPAEQAESPVSAGAPPSAAGEQAPADRAAVPRSGARLELRRNESGAARGEIQDLFASRSWYVPPPPPAPKPPEAPPLPFTYLGRLIDGGRVTVYLADQNRNLAVKAGDVIDGIYRVQRISPARVTFLYIPMNQQQTLEIGRNN